MQPKTAIIIGTPGTCARLEQQLDLLAQPPTCLGWILTDTEGVDGNAEHEDKTLGTVDHLETLIGRHTPEVALISLPAAMNRLVIALRTRLRRIGTLDRFIATLEDQLAGIGPRTHLDIDVNALINRPARHFDEQFVRRVITGRRVLITGAGGSIGSELARIVADFDPSQLFLVERAENALFEIDRRIAARHPQLARRPLLHDVVDADSTRRLLAEIQPQVIFHAAAHKHVPMMEDHPAAALENNFYGTKSVADAADMVGVERFVMISTDKAVRPVSVMGATKRLAEMYVQHINRSSPTGFAIVRFGNVLGSTGSVLDIWAAQLAEGGPITVTHPDMTRYFMTIPEAASLVIQSAALVDERTATGESAGDVFLLDMGEPVRIVDLARRYIAMHGLEPVLDGEPLPGDAAPVRIVFTGARPGEKMVEELAGEGEPISPSGHPDIFVWELAPPDPAFVQHMLGRLSTVGRHDQPAALAQLIRNMSRGPQHPVLA